MITLPSLVKTIICTHSYAHNTSVMCFWHCNANRAPHSGPSKKRSIDSQDEDEKSCLHECCSGSSNYRPMKSGKTHA